MCEKERERDERPCHHLCEKESEKDRKREKDSKRESVRVFVYVRGNERLFCVVMHSGAFAERWDSFVEMWGSFVKIKRFCVCIRG